MTLIKILGLVGGAVLGFLLFGYEHGGGGGGGDWYRVYIAGMDVFHLGGYFADFGLLGARLLCSAAMGIAGFLIAGRLITAREVGGSTDRKDKRGHYSE